MNDVFEMYFDDLSLINNISLRIKSECVINLLNQIGGDVGIIFQSVLGGGKTSLLMKIKDNFESLSQLCSYMNCESLIGLERCEISFNSILFLLSFFDL
jgi:hypothetical protein